MGKLNTHSPCITKRIIEKIEIIVDTLDRIYLRNILYVQCLQIRLHNGDIEIVTL